MRVPRLLPLGLPADANRLYAAAARSLYHLWWESDYAISEDQSLEIIRLALRGQETEIAVTVGDRIATHRVNRSRFEEARSLCQVILHQVEDYRILGTIARAEQVLGATADAIRHYEQALHHCPEADFSEKAATLNNMALVVAQQGAIERALQLWQEDLEISERIGDVQGKAATLNNMAGVVAQQGDIERALQLWQEDLEISERIGDVKGKAATLNNMATTAYRQGDIPRAVELLRQVAGSLGTVRAFVDLITVLNNLDAIEGQENLTYLAQAVWLCLRIHAPLQTIISTLKALYNRVPQGDGMEPLLAATALFVCQVRGAGHPQLNDLQHTSLQMVANAAVSQGVEVDSLETLTHWMAAQQLNDPQVFLPRLNQQLVAMIGNHWLFDPTGFQ